LLAAILIIAVLVGLFMMSWQGIMDRSEAVRCGMNMRSIHSSLANYLQDRSAIWPQEPENLDQKAHDNWWLQTLEPYGAPEEVWQCPTIKRKILSKASSKGSGPRLSYSPTSFDDRPGTAYRWSTQPWLMEIGNMHGAGALICFPDGSTKTTNEVMGYTK
jgi:type II secretory pathway pseudopilin PulG